MSSRTSSSRRLATTGSWPRPGRSLGTWATPTSGSSISSSPSRRTRTLCPPKSSVGLSLRGRLALPSVTSSLRKGGAAGEATHRRSAAVPSQPCQRAGTRPDKSAQHAICRRSPPAPGRSVLGPYRIGNLGIWAGTSGHDGYNGLAGRSPFRRLTSVARPAWRRLRIPPPPALPLTC